MDQKLDHSKSLDLFFSERLQEVLKNESVKIAPEVELYLVNLLSRYSKSENLFQINADGKVEYKSLALKLHDAVFATEQNQKYTHFKSLGDTALYHAGIFLDGVQKGVVDINYYVMMGGGAYQSLANLSTIVTHNASDMYAELAEKFSRLTEVIYLCCKSTNTNSNNDIINLLEIYIKTGSPHVKKILADRGIFPDQIILTDSMIKN